MLASETDIGRGLAPQLISGWFFWAVPVFGEYHCMFTSILPTLYYVTRIDIFFTTAYCLRMIKGVKPLIESSCWDVSANWLQGSPHASRKMKHVKADPKTLHCPMKVITSII
jgi:hypothetical protein